MCCALINVNNYLTCVRCGAGRRPLLSHTREFDREFRCSAPHNCAAVRTQQPFGDRSRMSGRPCPPACRGPSPEPAMSAAAQNHSKCRGLGIFAMNCLMLKLRSAAGIDRWPLRRQGRARGGGRALSRGGAAGGAGGGATIPASWVPCSQPTQPCTASPHHQVTRPCPWHACPARPASRAPCAGPPAL